jgi:hypothetical protein
MEMSGQLRALAAFPPGKEFIIKFDWCEGPLPVQIILLIGKRRDPAVKFLGKISSI